MVSLVLPWIPVGLSRSGMPFVMPGSGIARAWTNTALTPSNSCILSSYLYPACSLAYFLHLFLVRIQRLGGSIFGCTRLRRAISDLSKGGSVSIRPRRLSVWFPTSGRIGMCGSLVTITVLLLKILEYFLLSCCCCLVILLLLVVCLDPLASSCFSIYRHRRQSLVFFLKLSGYNITTARHNNRTRRKKIKKNFFFHFLFSLTNLQSATLQHFTEVCYKHFHF